MLKRTSIFLIGVLFAFTYIEFIPAAHAAVPTPAVSLIASAAKISGTSWTNDGSLGGNVTLAGTSVTPTFTSADTSVALNANNLYAQYIYRSLGNASALSAVTFEINMKVPSSQAYGTNSSGMVLGWTSSVYYDIWINGGCIGFNTGAGEVYGITNTSNQGDFHTYTFIMSTYADDTTKQKLFVDGVAQSISLCSGSAPTQGNKANFAPANATFTIGKYGDNGFYGSFNIRTFKLWTSELTTAQIQESYSSTLQPTSHTIALTSGLNSAVYRTNSTIRSNTDVDGKVTFFSNGKRIPGCINLQTTSKQVECTWKPSAINYNTITAQLVAPGGSLTTTSLRIFVSKRANTR